MAGGTVLRPASSAVGKLRPDPCVTVPIQAKVPAATPLMTSAPTAAASLPLNHRERLTAPASRWSRRPAASSARAA